MGTPVPATTVPITRKGDIVGRRAQYGRRWNFHLVWRPPIDDDNHDAQVPLDIRLSRLPLSLKIEKPKKLCFAVRKFESGATGRVPEQNPESSQKIKGQTLDSKLFVHRPSRTPPVSAKVCEKNGTAFHSQNRRLVRWAEHFGEEFSWLPATQPLEE
ncbi:hypothetical protein CLF_109824 [Clonorchis sinensis]|uniref:Uncharacterized protein n=1 Tax=Clonorchis sinensis TaxID=79923 RepID=G7YSZ1_CLOSI|nr:hypothetical protein CLF_109824 [Clonorchis sinensis]